MKLKPPLSSSPALHPSRGSGDPREAVAARSLGGFPHAGRGQRSSHSCVGEGLRVPLQRGGPLLAPAAGQKPRRARVRPRHARGLAGAGVSGGWRPRRSGVEAHRLPAGSQGSAALAQRAHGEGRGQSAEVAGSAACALRADGAVAGLAWREPDGQRPAGQARACGSPAVCRGTKASGGREVAWLREASDPWPYRDGSGSLSEGPQGEGAGSAVRL